MKRLLWVTTVVALLIGVAGQPASATIMLTLDTTNLGGGFTGPYATVNITRTSSTTADIQFNSLTNGGFMYLFLDGSSVALNVNASSFSFGTVTGLNSGTGFSPGPFSDGGSGNVDGFGGFNLRIDSFDSFTHASDTISFTLTNLSGTWGSDSDVLTANAFDHLAAAHVGATTPPANASNGAVLTGFVTNGTPIIPEPTTLVLLGLGLASSGMGIMRRRRK